MPNIILAIVIFSSFPVHSILGGLFHLAVREEARESSQGVALLLASLVHTTIVVIDFLIGLSVVAPSFQASDLIKVLGVGTATSKS